MAEIQVLLFIYSGAMKVFLCTLFLVGSCLGQFWVPSRRLNKKWLHLQVINQENHASTLDKTYGRPSNKVGVGGNVVQLKNNKVPGSLGMPVPIPPISLPAINEDCEMLCDTSYSPICVTNGYKRDSFYNTCEFYKAERCCPKKYGGWRVYGSGMCLKNSKKGYVRAIIPINGKFC